MKKTKMATVILIISSISFFLGAALFSPDGDFSITKSMIENAEKIIGLEFTDAERDSMIGDLTYQLENYNDPSAY